MENRDKQNPQAGQENDLSKAQSAQQPQAGLQPPQAQARQQPESEAEQGEIGQSPQQPSGDFEGPTGQRAGASDTITEQRSDIEGGTATGQATDIEGSSTFVGSESASDTSGILIEDDDYIDDRRGDGE